MSTPIHSVGLVGCSLAGSAITERLVRAGMRVFSHDLTDCPLRPIVRLGASCIDTPMQMAGATSRVILATGGAQAPEAVLWGINGLLTGPRKPRYVIDLDTIPPEDTADHAARAERIGVELIDATLTGTYKTIGHGQGGLIVGGGAAAVNACSDIFDALATTWSHVGGAGSAANGRLILAMLVALQRSALAETIAHAEALGIRTAAFVELVRTSPAYSPAAHAKARPMIDGDYAAERRVDDELRAIEAARKRADAVGQNLPLTNLHATLLADAVGRGREKDDVAVLIESIRRHPASWIETAEPAE